MLFLIKLKKVVTILNESQPISGKETDGDMKRNEMKYTFPNYKLKSEFTVGTWGENDWELGETACVDRHYYHLPNGSEYAVFKFCTRTHTGGKRLRWELHRNGRFANNYFTCVDDAVRQIENEISFNGFKGGLQNYVCY